MTIAKIAPKAPKIAKIAAAPAAPAAPKATVQGLLKVFHGYDAGTRTKALRSFASERSLTRCIELNCINDAAYEAIQAHSKLSSGKVAMMQIAKSLDFIASGDVKALDAATGAFIIMSYLLNSTEKPQTFENARFTLSASGNENSRPIDGINGQSLRQCIGKIKRGTVEAQTSRTVGVNGTLGIMGATKKTDKHEFTILPDQQNNPFIVAYCKALSKIPEGDLLAKFEALKSED